MSIDLRDFTPESFEENFLFQEMLSQLLAGAKLSSASILVTQPVGKKH